ncbi:MAG: hypothetical protein ABIQ65_06410, partial [Thermoanaerobaculia bacterium]
MKFIESFRRFLLGRDRTSVWQAHHAASVPLEEPLPGTSMEDWLTARLGPRHSGYSPESLSSHAKIAADLALEPRRRELARDLENAKTNLNEHWKPWVAVAIVIGVVAVEVAVAERLFFTIGIDPPWSHLFAIAHAATAIGLAAAVARKASIRPSYVIALLLYLAFVVGGAVLRTGGEVAFDDTASRVDFWATVAIF